MLTDVWFYAAVLGWGAFAVAMTYNLTSAAAVRAKIEALYKEKFGGGSPTP